MLKRLAVIATVVVASLAAAAPAKADVILDFGTGDAGAGGTITSLGGGNWSGTGIRLDSLVVVGSPALDGTYDLTGAGGDNDANGSALLSFNTATGAFSIVGGVAAPLNVASTTLLSGTIGGFTIVQNTGTLFQISFAPGTDTKAPTLLTALGLPLNLVWTFSGFSIGANGAGAGPPYTATSTDIANVGTIPEPATLMLFGAASLGLVPRLRRRHRNVA